MNTKRFVMAAVGVWLVRATLNAVFYAYIMRGPYEQIISGHPGMFREVIPAYIGTDLIFALVFAFLFAQVAIALGGGVKAGVNSGSWSRSFLPSSEICTTISA